MKRAVTLFCALLAAGMLMPSGADAETSGSAEATVYTVVNPNIAVGVITPVVAAGTDLTPGSIQKGEFFASISFRVDANMQEVSMYVEASALYKGDSPTTGEVRPMPILVDKGVEISPTDANPPGGASNIALFLGPGTPIGDYPTLVTEMIEFSSGQDSRFSQDVIIVLWWLQDWDERPTGPYSGKVKLTCLLIP